MTSDEKKCPYCAEIIKAEAVKCRYCKSDLPPEETSQALPEEPAIKKQGDEPELEKGETVVDQEKPKYVKDNTLNPWKLRKLYEKEDQETKPVSKQISTSSLNKPVGEIASEVGKKAGVALVAGADAAHSSSKRLAKRIAEWWKNPKFRKGTCITAGVVAAIIIALIVVAVVMHKSPEEVATSKAMSEAKTFLKYASDEDYEAMLSCIDNSSYPLLKAELCQGLTEGKPADLLVMDDTSFEKMLVDSSLPSLFEPSVWKSLKVVGGKKIADKTYVVLLKKLGKSKEGMTIIVKSPSKGSYSIDLAGLPAILYGINQGKDNRNIAEYITDSVNKLIANPTEESCLTAIAWLASSEDLEDKYELLVSDKYRNYVSKLLQPMTQKSKWEKAKNLVAKFPELAEKAEKEMDNFRTVDDYITVTGVSEGKQYTAGQTANVTGTVKEDCTLTFNGQPVGVDSKTKQFAPVATIAEGANRLSLVVTNKRGKTYNKEITVVGIRPAPPPPPQPPSNPSTVTMAEYNQLEYGMTYEEVCAIIGGPGKFFDEDNPAVGPGKVYFWFGAIDPASNVCCRFVDGILVDKAESHLQ